MTSAHRPPDSPHVQEVEQALGLREADRADIPGLYVLNVERVPRSRVVGMQVLLAFAAVHNHLLDVPVSWRAFLAVAVVVELYAAAAYVIIRRFFARLRRLHLGTVFLVLDLAVFSLVLYATGAQASWLWPLYLLRVGDQMWIGRRRAAGMAFFLAVMAWAALVDGSPVDWGGVVLKLSMLGAMSGYLVVISGLPWDLKGRTQAAKAMILKLEAQSEALEVERARAERASQAKTEFLARMSHELRTPLNSVVGFANVLLKPGKFHMEGPALDYLVRIRDNGVHLLALINDVLDIARIDEGTMEIHVKDVDLEALVRDTAERLAPRIQDKPVRLSVSFPRALSPLRADETRLRQILINLLGNAMKFTSEGFIRVEVDADASGAVPRSLRVVDSGMGIAPHRLPGIFEAFEQGEGSTRRKQGGTGVGLALSRALCHLQGFDLTAESEEGKGSTFTVHFARDVPRGPSIDASTEDLA